MREILLKRKSVFLLSFSIVLLDQLSKFSLIRILSDNSSISVVPKLIHFRIVKNTGAAFSLFSGSTYILGLLSLLVSIGIISWIWKNKHLSISRGVGLSCLLGGCIGNGLDRWRFGYVIDFIELIPVKFPIFNAADIAINIAVICLFIETVSTHNKHNAS